MIALGQGPAIIELLAAPAGASSKAISSVGCTSADAPRPRTASPERDGFALIHYPPIVSRGRRFEAEISKSKGSNYDLRTFSRHVCAAQGAPRRASTSPTRRRFSTRSKVRLLANLPPRCRETRPRSIPVCGHQLADEAQTCVAKMRVVPAILYTVYVEKTPDEKFAGRDYLALPPDVEREDYVWRCGSGNFLEHTPRLAGVFEGLEAEFDFCSGTTRRRSRARSTLKPKAGSRSSSSRWARQPGVRALHELLNTRQQPYWSPTYAYVAAAGEPDGPSEADIMKALAIADIVEAAIAEATKEANERASRAIESRPANRIEYSTGKTPKAPAWPDGDIPF